MQTILNGIVQTYVAVMTKTEEMTTHTLLVHQKKCHQIMKWRYAFYSFFLLFWSFFVWLAYDFGLVSHLKSCRFLCTFQLAAQQSFARFLNCFGFVWWRKFALLNPESRLDLDLDLDLERYHNATGGWSAGRSAMNITLEYKKRNIIAASALLFLITPQLLLFIIAIIFQKEERIQKNRLDTMS